MWVLKTAIAVWVGNSAMAYNERSLKLKPPWAIKEEC
jgi:hypothetical protein